MKIANWLHKNTRVLQASDVESARLDCLILLEDVTGLSRASLLAHPEKTLTSSQLLALDSQVLRRTHDEPLAYIRGKVAFYGREFMVNKHVLVPRPESEDFLDLLEDFATTHQVNTIIDVGTGSGALAISAKLLLPNIAVVATDIDASCLAVAQKNSSAHQTEVTFIKTNLVSSVEFTDPSHTVLLANLPYVPDALTINQAATHEPPLAIFGGEDGLNLYRGLFTQLAPAQQRPLAIFCESLSSQHTELAALAKNNGYRQLLSKGLIQVFIDSAQLQG